MYGRDNFIRETIEDCYSLEELNEREKYWIEYYDAVKSREYYNISSGGDGGYTLAGYSDEERYEIYKKANKGKNRGAKNCSAKRVICLNDMKIFDTTVEAAEYYGVKDYNI